jgi:NADH dehydrogenase [ubiquinone] 1 alpha subcomplex assembly factor 5
MTATDNPSEIFDRNRRRSVRDRAYTRARGEDFIHKAIADELYERLQMVSRPFHQCLLMGLGSQYLAEKLKSGGMTPIIADSSFLLAAESGGVQCDEDRLPFADASFDLVISMGTLDTVNDLPGALTLIRKVLKPDGLFLGAFLGAESLTTLKSTLLLAEGDSVRNHIHPQIDIRTMGDLLQRTGFALPVVDGDSLTLRYPSLSRLLADIRDFGGSNILKNTSGPILGSLARTVTNLFADRSDDQGKVSEFLEIIHVSGWAPHPDQPKAAPRGSGQMSLTNALKDRS